MLPLKKKKLNRRTMASNPTPDDDDVALALAEDLADGCNALEVTLGIKQNTEAVIRAAIDAVLSARQAHATKLQTLRDRVADQQAADTAGTTNLTGCQLRFSLLFGKHFNSQWSLAGWPGQTTSIPTLQDQRFTLLNKMKIYFTANPASESADMGATAALCNTAHTNISNARAQVNLAETAEGNAFKARNDAMKVLRKRIRGLINELTQLLAEDDQRWESFGLNIPANPSPPVGIANLTLTTPATKKIHCLWTYATRMNGTRIKTKRQGIDTLWINAGTADGLEKTLEGFAPGDVVDVQVFPYNDGGDGPGSPVRTITVT